MGPVDIGDVGTCVLSADGWRMRGIGRTRLRDAVKSGEMVVAHRGWYVDAAIWNGWYPEARHVAKSIAAVRSMRSGDIVLSHASAAAVWGLPFYRFAPARVHVTGPRSNGVTRGASKVTRHEGTIDGQRAVVHGIPVTTLARTTADVIGRLPLEAAVALADAALRQVAWRGGSDPYDEDAASRWKDEVLACGALQAGARGSSQSRWVIGFADGRAQLPGESVSRLYLHQLGFAPPRLQVRVEHDGGWYDIDLGLDDVGVWGEFDGTRKYTDPTMLAGRTIAEVVLDEKWREDDIRGRTRRPVIRWGSPHIASLSALRVRLAEFHVHPPGGPGRIPPTFSGRGL